MRARRPPEGSTAACWAVCHTATMRPKALAATATAAIALLLAAGCGGSDDAGSETSTTTTEAGRSESTTTTEASTTTEQAEPPTGPVTYTSGEATVEITGGDEDTATLDLSLDDDDDNELDPGEGSLDLVWVDDDENSLKVSVTATGVDVGPIDAFVRIEIGGFEKPYVDSLHTLCDVEITTYAAETIEGEYNCEGLAGFSTSTDGQTIDVEGSFSANA